MIDADTRPDEHRSERVANDSTGPDDEAVEGSWSPRRPKASSGKSKSTSAKVGDQSPDPDVLVDEIEKTREELAETLDAIADKVSPKRVVDRTKKSAKDGANDAKDSVKTTAAGVAATVKGKVAEAVDEAKDVAADVKEKVSGDSDDPKSPLAPATSVELDAATPVPGVEVPVEPAPTPGALADASVVAVEPAGTEAPAYLTTLPPQQPSRTPMLAGAGAALALVLLLAKRRRGRRRRR